MSENPNLDPQVTQLAAALFQQWSAQVTPFHQQLSDRLDQHQAQILALSANHQENLQKNQKK